MEKTVLIISLVALSILTLIAFSNTPSSFVEIGSKRFSIEVASTPEELQAGLMFRETLCSDCGMLFIFNTEEKWNFWMKNTLLPLDIVFISENKTVVTLHHAVPCEKSDCPLYSASEPAKYVLEVNAGTFDDSIIGKEVEIVV